MEVFSNSYLEEVVEFKFCHILINGVIYDVSKGIAVSRSGDSRKNS